jgi:hypothetical protein
MHRLKVLLWAAMHSPSFKYCYLIFPITISIRRVNWMAKAWSIELHFQRPFIYLPWEVLAPYLDIHQPGWKENDGIPF